MCVLESQSNNIINTHDKHIIYIYIPKHPNTCFSKVFGPLKTQNCQSNTKPWEIFAWMFLGFFINLCSTNIYIYTYEGRRLRATKNQLLLSTEPWLINSRILYFMVYYDPYLTGQYNHLYKYPKQPRGAFFSVLNCSPIFKIFKLWIQAKSRLKGARPPDRCLKLSLGVIGSSTAG